MSGSARVLAVAAALLVLALGATAAAAPRRELVEALDRLDFGDYEGVVALLRGPVERGADFGGAADRQEALRIYGIACALTGRNEAAEGAFLLLLRADPSLRLSPALVRPEAIALFDEVRARHRAELLAIYNSHPRRAYAVLNLLPPWGQFQNQQRLKGALVGGFELGLLTINITTGALLGAWQRSDHTFAGHTNEEPVLRALNIGSFVLLGAVVIYGIVDGFVVFRERRREDRAVRERLLQADAARRAVQLVADGGGLGVTF